jgi:hypothetical protein
MNPSKLRFRLYHAMILVLALALALAMVWHGMRAGDLEFAWLSHGAHSLGSILQSCWSYVAVSLPFGVTLSASILALTWLDSRPADVPLAHRPGFVACMTASLVMTLAAVGKSIANWVHVLGSSRQTWGHYTSLLSISFWQESWEWSSKTATGVAVGWSILAHNRVWKPVPTWMDRAGRLIGIYWLLVLILSWFSNLAD